MNFIEDAIFPTDISDGSLGGPGFKTNVRVYGSGYESRRVRWPYPRHAYNVAYGVKTAQQMQSLINFYTAMDGKGYGFRYVDPLDNSTSPMQGAAPTGDDVVLVNGDGDGTSVVQLFKPSTEGSRTTFRPIKKPVDNANFAVNVDASPVGYTMDFTTGILTLTVPLVLGQVLSWGGNYHVPCRFDTDQLQITLQGPLIGNTNIGVVEIFT